MNAFYYRYRDKVVRYLNKANLSKHQQKQISSWDFSTLYTNIPHQQLKDNLEIFVNKVFGFMDKEFIRCSHKTKEAYFCKHKYKGDMTNNGFCFDKLTLINAINCIIDNSYILFQNQVFRQVIGIPMGTNCAPFLANIYLHIFEYNYIAHLVEIGDVETAKRLTNTLRFQDDLIAINDNKMFSEHFNNIYPPVMVLKNTNVSRDKVTYLDLTISIYRGKYMYYSYDKRKDFDFKVVNYPNLTGNVPSAQSYGVFTSQLVRFCEINQNSKHFLADTRDIIDTLHMQGYCLKKMKVRYLGFCRKFLNKWGKYNMDISASKVVNKLFQFA